jgi:hypothetical protein
MKECVAKNYQRKLDEVMSINPLKPLTSATVSAADLPERDFGSC